MTYDSDTLEIPLHGQVPVIGFAAPEHQDSAQNRVYHRRNIPPEQLRRIAAESRDWLIREGKYQQGSFSLEQTLRGSSGRLLAYVHLPDGRLLNALLVE